MGLFQEFLNIVGNMNDSISSLISTIKNGVLNNKLNLIISYNYVILEIIKLLYVEGYIINYKIVKVENNTYISYILKKNNGSFLIHEIKRVSKPSQKVYLSINELTHLYSFCKGDTTYIISTPSGVYTGKTCIQRGISGEILFKIN